MYLEVFRFGRKLCVDWGRYERIWEEEKKNVLNEARLHVVKAFSMLISDFISFPLNF
jgi:hypothetical protein